ncbi:hypothetical protein D3C87_1723810 [compost metagenome]
MKCIPATFSGRFVAPAIFVIEMEDVFVTSKAAGFAMVSRSLKILIFRSMFSVAASMMISASLSAPKS